MTQFRQKRVKCDVCGEERSADPHYPRKWTPLLGPSCAEEGDICERLECLRAAHEALKETRSRYEGAGWQVPARLANRLKELANG